MGAIGQCCCAPAGGTTCSVCGCSSFPVLYSISMSGVTNLSCTNCSGAINGGHTLAQVVGTCEWKVPSNPGACGGFDTEFYIQCSTPVGTTAIMLLNVIDHNFGATIIAQYTASLTTWSCLGTNVMAFNTANNFCTSWPTAITVIPV